MGSDKRFIVERIQMMICDLLQGPLQDDNQDASFVKLGLSSLTIVELAERLEKEFGIQAGVEIIYDHATPGELAQYLVERMASSGEPGASSAAGIEGDDELHAHIRTGLQRILAGLIGNQRHVDQKSSFFSLGLDSVSIVAFTEQINAMFHLQIGMEVVFDQPTMEELIPYLAEVYSRTHGSLHAEAAAQHPSFRSQEHASADKEEIAEELYTRQGEKIAIVGISGRFAGAASLNEYWDNLIHSRQSVGEIRRGHWEGQSYFSPDSQDKSKSISKWAGLLDNIARFDADFFNISPREAERMDPQQRLLLEEVYKALEDGGYAKEKIQNHQVGVFIGARTSDYINKDVFHQYGIESQMFLGSDMGIMAGRISYFFNLHGPSLTVDTACSSALAALHYACESIRKGDCSMAIVGSVFLMPTPDFLIQASKTGMLSPDGSCKTFDNTANGIAVGEGVGAVLLKPLSRAIADRDNIHAVISGSSINQDGKTNGITAPSAKAQEKLVLKAWENADVHPEAIGYIEVHGTGTKLGDPIEVRALTNAFRERTDKKQFCRIGSHKPNIGHTINAAGFAGLFKTVLALKHKKIPPTIHYRTPNEHIDFANSPFMVNTDTVEWTESPGRKRKAGVSSFGFSGTNCHVILEEGISWPVNRQDRYCLVPVSARSNSALVNKLAQLKAALVADESIALGNVARTLQEGRDHFRHRVAFLARDKQELIEKLEATLAGRQVSDSAVPLNGHLQQDYGRLLAVKEQYESGGSVDWSQFRHGDNSILVSLPAYPFEGADYWIQPARSGQRSDLNFKKMISREEQLIRDHHIQGNYLLPGAGHIAFICEAVEEATGNHSFVIEDLYLLRPVVLQDKPKALAIRLEAEDGGYAVQIASEAEDGECLHAQGRVTINPGTDAKGLRQVSPVGNGAMSGREFYRKLSWKGANYGSSLRVIEQVEQVGDDVHAILNGEELSAAYAEKSFRLAAILDGALQCLLAFDIDEAGMFLPFSIGRVRLLQPFKDRLHITAARSGRHAYDIWIRDLDGEVCACLEEVVIQPAKKNGGLDLFCPVWHPVQFPAAPASRKSAAQHVLIVVSRHDAGIAAMLQQLHREDRVDILYWDEHAPSHLDRVAHANKIYFISDMKQQDITLEDFQEFKASESASIGALFKLVKWMDARSRDGYLDVTVLTHNVYATETTRSTHPYPALLFGFARSLQKEYPNWKIRIFDLDLEDRTNTVEDTLAKDLAYIASETVGNGEYVIKNARLYEQQLWPVSTLGDRKYAYRTEGVYVIVGGAGGIGFELCKHLARSVRARIVIVGRRSLDVQLEQKLEEILQLGGQYTYVQADLGDESDLRRMVREAKARYGVIHGVVHSALVLKDKEIRHMTEDVLYSVLAPKVTGVRNLYQVFRNENLDFMLFFSSCQSFVGNAGQSNYAAASSFEDAFCDYVRDTSAFPVKVINWGYWGSVGVVSNETYQRMMALQGYRSIEPAEGMEMIDAMLASSLDQAVIMKAEAEVYEQLPVNQEREFKRAVFETESIGGQLYANLSDRERRASEVSAFLAQLEQLQSDAKRRIRQLDLANHPHIPARFKRLVVELTEMLKHDRMQAGGEPSAVAPTLQGFADLLFACLDHYEAILTGKIEATEVMFPQSSMHLVEAIYRNNPLSDTFIQIIAELAQSSLEKWRSLNSARSVSIIEIGAGTGSTAESVCKAISNFANVSYTYTDISHSFLNYGRKKLGESYPFVDYSLLDIEKDIADQGYEEGRYDIVIATNVLHATGNMSAVLGNVKRLLKRNGLLLVNEMTRKQDYLTMTFGLLDGWWKYEDGAYRETGSPILNNRSWRYLLNREGFRNEQFIGLPVQDQALWSQHVIVAESDGFMRTKKANKFLASPERAVKQAEAPVENSQASHGGANQKSAVTRQVCSCIADCLGVKPEQLDMQKPFAELGVDSIVGVEMVTSINRKLKLQLKNTVLFDYNHASALIKHILTQYPEVLASASASGEVADNAESDQSSVLQKQGQEGMLFRTSGGKAGTGVAIVGLSGRFADYDDVEQYWQGLCEGRSSIREIPQERWDVGYYYDPDTENYEKTNSKWCGWLKDIDQFDPLFFNMSGSEALYTDPQQRIFLEECWKALEDAGHLGNMVSKYKYGVFAGIMEGDYLRRLQMLGVKLEPQAFWGNDSAILASRISYLLDLHGPCVTVNTACSSSLVAIHLACQSILAGESDVAIAGGSYMSTTPNYYILSSNAGMFSPEGLCKTFDQNADGFVLGEGAGAVVLKSLDKAIQDGDFIYGVIKGTGINQDGKTNGITAPSGLAQTSLELEVYKKSGVNPETISYVEAHGTGTKLGDPIEFEALTNAFRAYTDKRHFCGIGSVKSNIGHTSAAAGVASLIKVLMAFRHQLLPPTIHYNKINENIDLENSPFYVNNRLTPWKANGAEARRAAVSSFGFSGTNAHLVVEEWPESNYALPAADNEEALLVFSAKSTDRLEAYLEKFASFVESIVQQGQDRQRAAVYSLRNMAYTLQTRRNAMKCRVAMVVNSFEDLLAKLRNYLAKEQAVNVFAGVVAAGEADEDGMSGEIVRGSGLEHIAAMWVQGKQIHWESLYAHAPAMSIPLPASVFLKKRYWFEGSLTAPDKRAAAADVRPVQPELPPSQELEAEHCVYTSNWIEANHDTRWQSPEDRHNVVLILDKDDSAYHRIRQELLREGDRQTALLLGIQGAAFVRIDHHRCIFDPANLRALIDWLDKSGLVPTKVVNLCGLGRSQAELSEYSLFYLRLVQALQAFARDRHMDLIHILANKGNLETTAQLALSGFARTLRTESPKLSLRTVMVEDNPAFGREEDNSDQLAAVILTELQQSDEIEIRYRNQKRFVKAWSASRLPAAQSDPFKQEGVYLLTGGMGGIGKLIARELAKEYKAKLAICGRSPLTAQTERFLEQLRQLGAEARYYPVDLAHYEDVWTMTRHVLQAFGRIDGVLHCAGVVKSEFLMKKSETEFEATLKPKLSGTIHLDKVLQHQQLDFFALFSSVSSELGTMNVADYAYANSFLNYFAERREERRKNGECSGRTMALCWPLWKEGGMPIDREGQAYMLQEYGLKPLEAGDGWTLLKRALSGDKHQYVLVKGDRSKFERKLSGGRAPNIEVGAIFRPLPEMQASHSQEIVRKLTGICAELFDIPAAELDSQDDFEEIGMNSIFMMKLLSRIEKTFDKVVEPDVVLNYPSIQKLSEYLVTLGVQPSDTDAPKQQKTSSDRQTPAVADIRISAAADALKPKNNSRIAVIGMSCRFPGANSPEAYWSNLLSGKELLGIVDEERWAGLSYANEANRLAENRAPLKWGGYLRDIDAFAAAHFKVNEKEAAMMDPQHRIMLELAQELFDHAGYASETLSGQPIHVMIGAGDSSYVKLHKHHIPVGSYDHILVNMIPNMIAARISDYFNLKGEAGIVDTACSSALVAIHKCCDDIRLGKCEMAVAGGVKLLIDPMEIAGFNESGIIAGDGKVRVFDEQANGTILGEGAGLVLLKDYDAAVRDGDKIWAVIAGSAVNNDGKTMGLTVPSKEGQKEVISQAIANSGVDVSQIRYFEAHGTGTLLGDPIEIKAASEAYDRFTDNREYCAVGSVKSNMGHLLQASGIAGFIKIVLSLHYKKIVPTLHCHNPHPRFKFAETPFYPALQVEDISEEQGEIYAAISAFGFGGTNCHMIVENFEASNVPFYRTVRQPLPQRVWQRKRYWLGRNTAAAGEERHSGTSSAATGYQALLQQVTSGKLTPEEAAELIRQQREIKRTKEGDDHGNRRRAEKAASWRN